MARKSQYSDEQKSAFVDAVKNGRKAEASWSEILEATKTQGYKGSLQYLKTLALAGGAIQPGKKKSAKPKSKKETLAALHQTLKDGAEEIKENVIKKKGKRMGRPKGSKNKPKVKIGRPKGSGVSVNGSGLGDIEKIVAGMVDARVKASIGEAIKALESAARELQSL